MDRREFITFSIAAGLLPLSRDAFAMTPLNFDVVIVGANMPGLIAAKKLTTLNPNRKVAVIDWMNRRGGMMTAGLTASDQIEPSSHWGRTRMFFRQMNARYGGSGKSQRFRFEAHEAAGAISDMFADEPNISFYLGQPVVGVVKAGATITSLTTPDYTFTASNFIDCSYDADLAVAAGVTTTYGREARSTYGEPDAGFRPENIRSGQYSGVDADGNLLANINYPPVGAAGSADLKSQAANFRQQVTTDPARMLPWPIPPDYDPTDFEHLAASMTQPDVVLTFVEVAPEKFDANHNDVSGALAWEWPTASIERRKEIQEELYYWYFGSIHYRAANGLVQQLANSGPASDEFVSDWMIQQHSPPMPYIRASRRIIGQAVLTEHDVLANPVIADSINVGGYMMDSHTVQRWPTTNGELYAEGHTGYSYRQHYSIPLGVIKPHSGQADNLLVPVCISCSELVWDSYRMEPTMMQTAESAAIATHQAMRRGKKPVDVKISDMAASLNSAGATTRWPL